MQTRPVARFIPQAAVRWNPMVAMGARRQPCTRVRRFLCKASGRDCQRCYPDCLQAHLCAEAGGGRAGRAGGRSRQRAGECVRHATHGRNQAAGAALGWTERVRGAQLFLSMIITCTPWFGGLASKRVRGRLVQRSAIGPGDDAVSGAAAGPRRPAGAAGGARPRQSAGRPSHAEPARGTSGSAPAGRWQACKNQHRDILSRGAAWFARRRSIADLVCCRFESAISESGSISEGPQVYRAAGRSPPGYYARRVRPSSAPPVHDKRLCSRPPAQATYAALAGRPRRAEPHGRRLPSRVAGNAHALGFAMAGDARGSGGRTATSRDRHATAGAGPGPAPRRGLRTPNRLWALTSRMCRHWKRLCIRRRCWTCSAGR